MNYHPIIDRLKRIAELLPTAIGGGGFVPSGTKQISITQNGTTTENVFSYANAEISVNVPTGIVPSGTKQISITQNGTTTEDVTQYANAEITVNVPTGGADYSKLVAGTYGNVVVDSDGVMTSSTDFTANYAYPLTKPIQINSGDVIQIAVLSSIRAFHEWHLLDGTTELQQMQTSNINPPYVTSITANFTGTVDNIKLRINPSTTGATVKFAWFINNKIVLG